MGDLRCDGISQALAGGETVISRQVDGVSPLIRNLHALDHDGS
jgi:hypothetical protein